MLQSAIQACETSRAREHYVGIYLDEFKYLISKPALEALGAIRDKKAHVTLAHQSIGDLRSCGADLDPESVIASVTENCGLKLAFKVHDPDTADWLSRMTGTILVDDEQRSFKTNSAFVEESQHERMLRQSERALVDSNMFLSLPKGSGVAIGDGLAEFFATVPVKLKDSIKMIEPTVVDESKEIVRSKMNVSEELIDVS